MKKETFEIILIVIVIASILFSALIQRMKETIKGRHILITGHHSLKFSHRLYLIAVFVISVVTILSSIYCLDENSKLYTVLLSTGLSVLAGIIVAVYSELKGSSSDKRNQLLKDIVDFSDAVNSLIIDLEYRCDTDKNLAAEYLKIIALQRNLQERYYEIKTMVRPIPSFGDSDVNVEEISYRISTAYFNRNNTSEKERDSIRSGILDSLYLMQWQLDMCKSSVENDTKVVNKPL